MKQQADMNCGINVLLQLKSVSQIPWCIGGDFNEIKAMWERSGCSRMERSMHEDFQRFY